MLRLCCCSLVALAVSLTFACGGSGEPPKTPEDDSSLGEDLGSDSSPSHGDSSSGNDGSDSNRSPATIKTTGAPAPAAPGDFEPSYSDCANLAAVYERLLRAEEMDKLEKKKLPPKVQASALEEVRKIVADGASQWRGQCDGIVDTVQIKPRWECAQKADSLKRFNGCMDGEFDGQ